MGTVARRLIRQIRNDRRSLGMMFVSPLVITTLLFFLMGKPNVHMRIGVIGQPPSAVVSVLEAVGTVTTESDELDISQALDDGIYDAVVLVGEHETSISLLEKNFTYESKIRDALASAQPQASSPTQVTSSYLHGDSFDTTFEQLAYALLGIMSFFLTFIVAGIWFVRERTQGTLERMMLTPVSRLQVATGYILGVGIFSIVQAILLLLFTRHVLGVEFVGGLSFALALLIMIAQAIVAVEMGEFISIFSNSEFQVAQFIPIIVIPQIFFSGIIPVETMPYGFDKVALIMPMYHACAALRHTLVYGQGIQAIWLNLIVLIVVQAIFIVANTLSLKRYRAL